MGARPIRCLEACAVALLGSLVGCAGAPETPRVGNESGSGPPVMGQGPGPTRRARAALDAEQGGRTDQVRALCEEMDAADVLSIGVLLDSGSPVEWGSAIGLVRCLGPRAGAILPQYLRAGERIVAAAETGTWGGTEIAEGAVDLLEEWCEVLIAMRPEAAEAIPPLDRWFRILNRKEPSEFPTGNAPSAFALARWKQALLSAVQSLDGGEEASVPLILQLMNSPWHEDRGNGVEACGRIATRDDAGGEQVRRALVGLLLDSNGNVRNRVEAGIRDHGIEFDAEYSAGVLLAMVSIIGPDGGYVDEWSRDDYFSWMPCLARAIRGDRKAIVDALVSLLQSPEHILRARAVLTIQRLGVRGQDVVDAVGMARSREAVGYVAALMDGYLAEREL